MGCDIHGWVEVYQFTRWIPTISVDAVANRNYSAFSALFGVRSDRADLAIANHRGMPKDISEQTRKDMEVWEGDAHSHSWITAGEVPEQWDDDSSWDVLFHLMRDCIPLTKDGDPAQVRAVVWFDN